MDFRSEHDGAQTNWTARDFTDCLTYRPLLDLDKAVNDSEAAYQASLKGPAASTPTDTAPSSAPTLPASPEDVVAASAATSPSNLFADSLTPPFSGPNSFADGPLVGSGVAVIESKRETHPLPLLPQVENAAGQLVPFENPLQHSEDAPTRFMGMGYAIEAMSRFVQGPLANFMLGTAQQLGRNANEIRQNSQTLSRLEQRQAELEKTLVKMGNLDQQTFKTTVRPQAQTDFLAHLVYNGIQTKAGFVAIIEYWCEEIEKPQVVVSVPAICQLFKRVGHGPTTLMKSRDTLAQVGFGDCVCLTENDYESLFSLFCLNEPQTPSTKQKRLMMMDSKNFFGLLISIPGVERKKMTRVNVSQFKKHAYTDDEWKHPDINTPFWKEVFGIWSAELESFVNRAKKAMGQQLDSSLDMGKRPYHIHGIKAVGFEVEEYNCVMTGKSRGKILRRNKQNKRKP